MHLDEFDYSLPPERIAQEPLLERGASRLLVLDRGGGTIAHRRFLDLEDYLRAGDLLVLNETAVIPARLLGRRVTGGRVEALLLRAESDGAWSALVKAGGSLRVGEVIRCGGADPEPELLLRIVAREGGGRFRVRFPEGADPYRLLEERGRVPLPPYIQRAPGDSRGERDRERYQTVYARVPGAVAAPTAGLHFTPAHLAALAARGIRRAHLVLHVGEGTFLPIRGDVVEEHHMHAERYELPEETIAALEETRRLGARIVACGTTTVRALEAFGRTGAPRGETEIFIHPPFACRWTDALITNFHLPRSTLLVLISALAGREAVLSAYGEALARGYRFASYGDAMLII
jgi:S-adenosylmethionine:tRNA ribosyltransferase-isomerase